MLDSVGELCFMLTLITLSIVIFSTACYLAEYKQQNTYFSSIPSAIWWSCITLTTVGYGDCIPETVLGKGEYYLYQNIVYGVFSYCSHLCIVWNPSFCASGSGNHKSIPRKSIQCDNVSKR